MEDHMSKCSSQIEAHGMSRDVARWHFKNLLISFFVVLGFEFRASHLLGLLYHLSHFASSKNLFKTRLVFGKHLSLAISNLLPRLPF
jgi:hypothetical protein